MGASKTPSKRLTKTEWIQLGLGAISANGGRRMSVDELAAALGVTSGSFYWHFRGREEFVRAVLEYWADEFTYSVGRRIEAAGLQNPVDELRLLMEILCDGIHTRYDIAVRAWASQEPVVARCLDKVDRVRLGVLRKIFERMGFTGDELLVRTRTFVIAQSLEGGLTVQLTKKQRKALIETQLKFFTR